MSSSPRFLFLHVTKTGGTSFVSHVLEEFPPDAVYPSAALDRRHATDAEPHASVPNLLAVAPERRGAIKIYAGELARGPGAPFEVELYAYAKELAR
jgi:hypothetical protein